MRDHALADISIAEAIADIIAGGRLAVIPCNFDIEHQLLLNGLFPVINTNGGDYRKLLYKYNIHHALPAF
ncbi:hypothetical protein UUU_37320 [Klebsiella pneumoniae subsp. pneumoniae DSM 30104 = JCM 1662 = NBRC 14940]|nr:hypothetical protein UUU_37320 [Klebsiella pneumoniae subsp. pneumoniae DSM 30104 = JCM 1662 = NBRC 14940]